MSMLVLWVGVVTLRLGQLSQATTATRRLQEVLLPRPTDHAEGIRTLPATGDLTAENISHAVDGHPVLAPAGLTVRPGELVTVTGPTGSGKTTLAKLMTGLYIPDSGIVRYDGHDLASLPPAELRRRIVLVPQRVHLIEGTLLDNLRLVPGDPDEKAIARAVEHLGLTGWTDALDDGLHTDLGRGADQGPTPPRLPPASVPAATQERAPCPTPSAPPVSRRLPARRSTGTAPTPHPGARAARHLDGERAGRIRDARRGVRLHAGDHLQP
ncbi:ATP-binding cassette domain-containing protein [Streptomyces sp. MT29]|nr:ATP-binding cassette domain-containing protein [Streptomyces sp. MT29]